jgi:copper(I)-binding protein
MRLLSTALVAGLVLQASAAWAGPKAGIVVSQAVVRASIGPSPNSAAYMTLTNTTGRPERLVSVRCGCAATVEAHSSSMAGGVMRMTAAGPVTIPPHGAVSFRPDGLHLMVMGLKAPLAEGGRAVFTLSFDHAPPLRVVFPVRARVDAAARPAHAMDMPGMDMGR